MEVNGEKGLSIDSSMNSLLPTLSSLLPTVSSLLPVAKLEDKQDAASSPSQCATDATVPAMEQQQQQQGDRNILTFGMVAQEEQCLNALK